VRAHQRPSTIPFRLAHYGPYSSFSSGLSRQNRTYTQHVTCIRQIVTNLKVDLAIDTIDQMVCSLVTSVKRPVEIRDLPMFPPFREPGASSRLAVRCQDTSWAPAATEQPTPYRRARGAYVRSGKLRWERFVSSIKALPCII
jgi:hypothetical protein